MSNNTPAQQEAAIQEGERIAAADEYFAARTWIMDTNDNRRIFEAGFDRAYALLSKLRAPVADEMPGGTRWPVLRAMARNYTAGKHTWDTLDAEACEQAAEEIRHLRAALASAPVACAHQFHFFGDQKERRCNRCNVMESKASAPVAGEAISDVDILGLAGQYIQPREPDAAPQIVNFARALLARYAAPQASEAQCSCPSGDGSLRHPCAVHPQASEAVRDWTAILPQPHTDMRYHGEFVRGWNQCLQQVHAALSAQPAAQKGASDA